MRNHNSRKLTVKAEPAEVDQQLKKQIEFYFSDSNLPRDKFLLHLTQKTPEGWVSLETISEFKKMRDMGATVRASPSRLRLRIFCRLLTTRAPQFSYLYIYISEYQRQFLGSPVSESLVAVRHVSSQ
jgi:hypothetical protein